MEILNKVKVIFPIRGERMDYYLINNDVISWIWGIFIKLELIHTVYKNIF